MKKYSVLLAVVCTFKMACAQNLVAKKDTGRIKDAAYQILFPANWKGKLVMYAHGYQNVGFPNQSSNPNFANEMKPFLERGFAVAASDYSVQGFAMVQGIKETEALRLYFVKKYGKPDTTFMAGHSMGGGITVATIENFGSAYNGALPMCPLSSRPYLQVRKDFDIYATFNAVFPGIAPSLQELFGADNATFTTSVNEIFPKTKAIRAAIVAKDSVLGVSFAKSLNLKFDDLPFAVFFIERILRDVSVKAKGNPFDNTNTIYNGFPENWDINKKIERIAATVNPSVLFGSFDRTGNINQPMVLLHTLYDPTIPSMYAEMNFENMVAQQGKLQNLTVKYTNGQGHCAFTPQQTGEAFDELRAWAKTGAKAKAGFIE